MQIVNDNEIELINHFITTTKNHFRPIGPVSTLEELEKAADGLLDQFMTISAALNRKSCDDYKVCWYLGIGGLLTQLLSLKSAFCQFSGTYISNDTTDSRVNQIQSCISQLYVMINELELEVFGAEIDFAVLASLLSHSKFSSVVFNLLHDIFESSMEPLTPEVLNHSQLKLHHMGVFLNKLFVHTAKNTPHVQSQVFVVVVEYLRSIYELGFSENIKLLAFLDAQLPLAMDVDVSVVSNYYIYMAFNLFVTNDYVASDINFRIYFNLPNSGPFLKDGDIVLDGLSPHNVNLLFKKEEIALMFYLNWILLAQDLALVIRHHDIVAEPLRFLEQCLKTNKPMALQSSTKSPTCILDRRFQLRLLVLRIVQALADLDIERFCKSFSLSSDSRFAETFRSLDYGPDHGVTKFYGIIDSIATRLKVLAFKFVVTSVGSCKWTESALEEVLGISIHVATNTPLLQYEVEGTGMEGAGVEGTGKVVYKFQATEPALVEEEMIGHQLELSREINELNEIYQENVFDRG